MDVFANHLHGTLHGILAWHVQEDAVFKPCIDEDAEFDAGQFIPRHVLETWDLIVDILETIRAPRSRLSDFYLLDGPFDQLVDDRFIGIPRHEFQRIALNRFDVKIHPLKDRFFLTEEQVEIAIVILFPRVALVRLLLAQRDQFAAPHLPERGLHGEIGVGHETGFFSQQRTRASWAKDDLKLMHRGAGNLLSKSAHFFLIEHIRQGSFAVHPSKRRVIAHKFFAVVGQVFSIKVARVLTHRFHPKLRNGGFDSLAE